MVATFIISMAKYIVFFLLLSARCSLISSHSRCLPSRNGEIFNVVRFGAIGDGHTDDTQAFKDAWEATCKSSSRSPTMHIPHGKSFLLQPLTFHGETCKSNNINFQTDGHLIAPSNPHAWKKCDGQKCLHWIQFERFDGLFIRGFGSINGRGANWWKLSCQNDKIVCGKKPTGFIISHSNNVNIQDLTFKDSPQMHVALEQSTNIRANNLTITAPGDSPNTDGIHIQHSSNVFISHSRIGTGDDCVSIGDGSSYISITNVHCGPGHGISIGSLGENGKHGTVEFVRVNHVAFKETLNGVRIKTWQGGKGYARKIMFENIWMDDSHNPIVIDQYYCPHEYCKNKTSAVKISDVIYSKIYGTSIKETAVSLACSRTKPCNNIIMKDIDLQQDISSNEHDHHHHKKKKKKTARAYCLNVRGTALGRVSPRIPCLHVEHN